MRRLRRAAAALCAALLLTSCANDGSYGNEISVDEFETDYSTVYAETIAFSGLENREYESELNESVAADVAAAVAEFDTLALEAAEMLPAGVKSTFRITQNVKRSSGGFISFIEEHYIYVGGAHGNTSWYPRTIYAISESPHPLALSELFSEPDYRDRLNILIERAVTEDPERYSELWEKPELTEENENNYYLTDTDLVIFFPPYTLSYYAKGFIEFNIKLTEIEGMIKDEYKFEKR